MSCEHAHQKGIPPYGYIGLSDLKKHLPEIYDRLLVKCEWQKEHELAFLKKEGTDELPEVIKNLLVMRKLDGEKYKKLVASIQLQLGQKEVVTSSSRVKPWKSNNAGSNKIYEFKSSAGLGFRLFFFFHNGDIIICTHGWVKNNEKDTKQQDQQFRRAETMRILLEGKNE